MTTIRYGGSKLFLVLILLIKFIFSVVPSLNIIPNPNTIPNLSYGLVLSMVVVRIVVVICRRVPKVLPKAGFPN